MPKKPILKRGVLKRGAAGLLSGFVADAKLAADEAAEWAAAEPEPDLARLFLYVLSSFDAAADFLFPRPAGSWGGAAFARRACDLNEWMERYRALPDADGIWGRWPRPGVVGFTTKAGRSALGVAAMFTEAVGGGVLWARTETFGAFVHGRPARDVAADDRADRRFDKWRDLAAKELRERTMPGVVFTPAGWWRETEMMRLRMEDGLARPG